MNNRLGCFSATGIIAALVALLAVAGIAYASGNALFSPGALSAEAGATLGGVSSHAEIKDCAACHTGPFSPSHMADRCQDCHGEVATQLQAPSGLHGVMWEATGETNCLDCHTEHHGGTASLTSIGMQGFPHRKLGFSLRAHSLREDGSPLVCADCHTDGYSAFDCATCHRQMDALQSDHVHLRADCGLPMA
jgi:hypothetical protein